MTSTHGHADDATGSAPGPINPATGQHTSYWILTEEERARGFVRPVRVAYKHKTCGGVTTMALAIAETYASDPKFYGATFCTSCRAHLPVSQFVWLDAHLHETNEEVGS